MIKKEFVDAVIKSSNMDCSRADMENIINSVFDIIKKQVKKNHKFIYSGFGTFSLKKRKARKGRNPFTGESIRIKASKSVGFKPATAFKEYL